MYAAPKQPLNLSTFSRVLPTLILGKRIIYMGDYCMIALLYELVPSQFRLL